MAEAQLQQFLHKIEQLNAFVALSEADPNLLQALRDCSTHHEVVNLAASHGFSIGRRWGEADIGGQRSAPADQPNLLSGSIPEAGTECHTLLMQGEQWRLERIHSCQASSPDGFWYDQPETEWVLLLQGSARLQFEDETVPRDLSRGDSLLISPHRRHRLVETDPTPGTIWLALWWWSAS